MARIVTNGTLWETFEPEEAPGLVEVKDFLSVLTRFDEGLVQELERERGKGRDDYPVRALWNTTVMMALLGHGKFSRVLGELQRNQTMAHMLGYRVQGGRVKVPKNWVISRFWTKLKTDRYRERVAEILDDLVGALKSEIPELGKKVAGDASDVRTHARPPGKLPKQEKTSQSSAMPQDLATAAGTPGEGNGVAPGNAETAGPGHGGGGTSDASTKVRPSADPEATWSVKTKIEEKDGQKQKRTEATFGYKAHALVDQDRPVVLAVRTTTGSHPDVLEAHELLAHASTLLGEGTIKEVALDKAYDDTSLIEDCFDEAIVTVIPVRDVEEDLKKQEAADREEPIRPGENVVYDRYSGEVFCYDLSASEPVRRQMVYAGFEKDRAAHKFRCPAAAKGFDCGYRAECGGGCEGKLGRQVRIPMKVDARRFSPIYPHSKHWERAYKGRSAVERLFSIFKESYHLEDHALRGKDAIELRVLLASITLNATTLQRVEASKAKAVDQAA